MKKFLKIIFYVFAAMVAILIIALLVFYYRFQKNYDFRGLEKNKAKVFLEEIKKFIYKEATIHNPPGDLVPDEIDNKILEEIEKKAKQYENQTGNQQ